MLVGYVRCSCVLIFRNSIYRVDDNSIYLLFGTDVNTQAAPDTVSWYYFREDAPQSLDFHLLEAIIWALFQAIHAPDALSEMHLGDADDGLPLFIQR